MKRLFQIFVLLAVSTGAFGQIGLNKNQYSLDDSLRGSITPERVWWDLLHYDLNVKVDIDQKHISGFNTIKYKALQADQNVIQIDLQEPLRITKATQNDQELKFIKKGANAYFITLNEVSAKGQTGAISVYYEGHPQEAKRAPWDGGFSWSTDSLGRPFIGTSCQGLGASVWWPCKDHMYDEPDEGMKITVSIPEAVMNISNGQLQSNCSYNTGERVTVWNVINPINNYGVNLNIGNYTHYSEVYRGENGDLKVDYYPLDYNLEKAKEHWKDVPRMLEAFEHWFGPYPFYEDGYKLVEAPYLGMEHQSSVTYGNQYKKGYLGRDISGSGWGLKWDFIIIHESAHEWFANNITYKDIADMWVHEGFTSYAEALFTEYFYGKIAGEDYVIGARRSIRNDRPIIGVYGVNSEGSSDMYNKGANMIHTIRHIINDDEKFRQILRGLNDHFRLQTVESEQIENFISEQSGIDLGKVFDQYLRNNEIPKLTYSSKGSKISYRWENVIEGFQMPVKVKLDSKETILYPTTKWKSIKGKIIEVDRNFYINF